MKKMLMVWAAVMGAFSKMGRHGRTLAVMLLGTMLASPAMAFTAPAAGSFGYDAYDLVVNKGCGGPLGWVGAAFLMIWGISNIMKQWLITVVCAIGAALIVKLPTVLTSLGALIS